MLFCDGGKQEVGDRLINAVAELDERTVLWLVERGLAEGLKPLFILKQMQIGVEKVGRLYEKGDYFIADLIMAGIVLKNALSINGMSPTLLKDKKQTAGRLLLGTAKGDLHDIGKNVFYSRMGAAGFEVLDLGVDVSPQTFVDYIDRFVPHIVGISGLMTLSLESMKETVEAIKEAGLRNKVKIILGGGAIMRGAGFVGADMYLADPSEAVKVCLDWVGK